MSQLQAACWQAIPMSTAACAAHMRTAPLLRQPSMPVCSASYSSCPHPDPCPTAKPGSSAAQREAQPRALTPDLLGAAPEQAPAGLALALPGGPGASRGGCGHVAQSLGALPERLGAPRGAGGRSAHLLRPLLGPLLPLLHRARHVFIWQAARAGGRSCGGELVRRVQRLSSAWVPGSTLAGHGRGQSEHEGNTNC